MERTNPLMRGIPPMHPGEHLREVVMPGLGEGVLPFARRLGVSRGALINILNEKSAITPAMALRLAKALNVTPHFWMNLQAEWDLAIARDTLADELAAIEPWKAKPAKEKAAPKSK